MIDRPTRGLRGPVGIALFTTFVVSAVVAWGTADSIQTEKSVFFATTGATCTPTSSPMCASAWDAYTGSVLKWTSVAIIFTVLAGLVPILAVIRR